MLSLCVCFFVFVFSNTQKVLVVRCSGGGCCLRDSCYSGLDKQNESSCVTQELCCRSCRPFCDLQVQCAFTCRERALKHSECLAVRFCPPSFPSHIHTHFDLPLHHTYEATAQGLLSSVSLRSDCESVKSNIWSAGRQRSKLPL